MEDVNQEGNITNMGEFTSVQDMKKEHPQPEENHVSAHFSRVELVVDIPKACLPLVNALTNGDELVRDELFTAFVVKKLRGISRHPEEIVTYMKDIGEMLEDFRMGASEFYGEEAELGEVDVTEKCWERERTFEFMEITLSLPVRMIEGMNRFSTFVHKTRERLVSYFIIECLAEICYDHSLIVEHGTVREEIVEALRE